MQISFRSDFKFPIKFLISGLHVDLKFDIPFLKQTKLTLDLKTKQRIEIKGFMCHCFLRLLYLTFSSDFTKLKSLFVNLWIKLT